MSSVKVILLYFVYLYPGLFKTKYGFFFIKLYFIFMYRFYKQIIKYTYILNVKLLIHSISSIK